MDIALTRTVSLLGVAIIVAIIARRMRLPYTVGLVITGIGLAVARLDTGAMLTHDFIFDVILPPCYSRPRSAFTGASCATIWSWC